MDLLIRCGFRCAFVAQLMVHAVVRPRVVGAHVVVRLGDRVLMVRNSYRRGLGFPAGRVGQGEDIRDAAARELREEVGIVVSVDDLRPLSLLVTRHEFKTDEAHVFELILEEEPVITIDRREVVWADFVRPGDLAGRLHAVVKRWLEGERRDVSSSGTIAEVGPDNGESAGVR